jgi:hypothetical protein
MKPSLCLLLGCFTSASLAWGPRFEPGHSAVGHRTGAVETVSRILVLQASLRKDNNNKAEDDEESENDAIEQYRSRLESSYSDDKNEFDLRDFLEPIEKSKKTKKNKAKRVAESLASTWLLEQQCGEDCEECLIPDDLKLLPETDENINVMEFLGIRRAEPLRKVGEWE